MEKVTDKLGDCAYCIVDEFKFWIEVIQAFMEWDEEGRQRWVEE